MITSLRKNLTMVAILYIVFGLVMLIAPVLVSDFICYIIGALFLVLGLSGIISYIGSKGMKMFSSFALIISILFGGLGIYIICNPAAFASFIPLVVGIMLIIDSINKFQFSFELKRNNYKHWWYLLLATLFLVLLGFMLIMNPFKSVEIFISIIGALLIFDGLSNLFTLYSFAKIKH